MFLNLSRVSPREKISHIVATGKGIPDEDAPHVLAETKYWCTVERKQVEEDKELVKQEAVTRTRVDADLMRAMQTSLPIDSYTNATPTAIMDADVSAAPVSMHSHPEKQGVLVISWSLTLARCV